MRHFIKYHGAEPVELQLSNSQEGTGAATGQDGHGSVTSPFYFAAGQGYSWTILSALDKFPEARAAVTQAVLVEFRRRSLLTACEHCRARLEREAAPPQAEPTENENNNNNGGGSSRQ